ncbi:ComEA family DNA-binding protein [Streptomyces sp. TRM 70351]|uniref:ComEA family DNA-binding protein n=1 Tax=Streptomyces sp. TRM 70351 TaxID=3116552 RepID=UPI002E7C212C|nr:ComEA family DNA-binding protein [Streptomyces sp. TRM 70351]MEE1928414.1 ComEA family DNA-binding protein [Streptomyces sp. TRM 70351]
MTSRSLSETRGPGRPGRPRPGGRRRTALRAEDRRAGVRARAARLVPKAPAGADPLPLPWPQAPAPPRPVPRPAPAAPAVPAALAAPAAVPLPRAEAIAAARAAVRHSRAEQRERERARGGPVREGDGRGGGGPSEDPGTEPAPGTEPGPGAGAGAGGGGGAGRAGARWLAVRERLPLWLQSRCAVEPRALAALLLVLLLAAGFGAYELWSGRPAPVPVPEATGPGPTAQPPPSTGPEPPAGPSPAAESGHVLVDVAGTVREPGVHRLRAGARVADALAAAGGVRPGTDTAGLNRARVLADGEHIVVGVTPTPVPAGPAPPGGTAAGGGSAVVSLNTATVEQLDTLPGIGPVLARQIVEHRTRHGGFRSVDDLRDVRGIGESRFADLAPRVTP